MVAAEDNVLQSMEEYRYMFTADKETCTLQQRQRFPIEWGVEKHPLVISYACPRLSSQHIDIPCSPMVLISMQRGNSINCEIENNQTSSASSMAAQQLIMRATIQNQQWNDGSDGISIAAKALIAGFAWDLAAVGIKMSTMEYVARLSLRWYSLAPHVVSLLWVTTTKHSRSLIHNRADWHPSQLSKKSNQFFDRHQLPQLLIQCGAANIDTKQLHW